MNNEEKLLKLVKDLCNCLNENRKEHIKISADDYNANLSDYLKYELINNKINI